MAFGSIGGSGGTSLSDSSTTASQSGQTQGSKFSGMNITASRETPPFIDAILGRAMGGTGRAGAGWIMPAALAAGLLLAVVILKRK